MHSSLAGLDNLPAIARTLLYLLASSGAGKSKNALLKQLQALKCRGADGRAISHQSLTELLKTLQQSGWIKPPEEGQPLRLAEDYRNPLLLHMQELPEAPAWRRTLLAGLPLDNPPWQPASRPQLLHRIWLHLLDDDLEGLINGLILLNRNTPLPTLATLHPLPALLADDAGHQLFASRHEDIRQLLLEHYLELSNTYLAPASSAYALGLEQLHGQITDDLALQLSLQACWRGDWNALRQLQRPSLGLLQQSIQHLLRGQAEDTLHLLRSWLGEQRRLTKKRKIDLPPILNGLYCLALFAENQPQHYPQLKQALALGNKEGYGAAYPVLQHLFEQLQGAKRQSLPGYLLAKPNGFDGLMLALGLYWLDAPEPRQPEWRKTLQDYRDQLVADDYHWLAAEFDALLAQQFGLPRQLAASHQDSGLQPLVKLHQRQESWQQALTALSLIRPGKGAANSAQSKSRLIWLIQLARYERRVEPLEQKLGAKGQWSKGRVVSLKRLAEETASLDYLSDQDRQVIACIRPGYSYHGGLGYELPPEQALPHLVGHPALYWKDAPETRIDLQAGQPSLYLDERAGQIHLHLEPRDLGDHDDLLLHKETPTRLRLYPISRELRQIAEIIGSGLSVPLSAKTQVVETLGSIAPLLPVHSEIPELAGQLDSVAADPRLYAHLLPLQEGLRLQLLVRPLAEGSWLRPGHGAQSLLGEQDGKSVQAQRDLAAERQALQQVLNACPGLANADSDGQEWQLDQPQDALQVLSELHALDGNTLHCVWPEGERMRIKGRSGLQQLRLGLKQQGNWFALQGEITLDDGKVLQLRQLLDLLKASPGRFLKLDERDWLALDDSLRKRLDELAHLAERVSDQGLRLSPLSAPLLAELASEAGEFEADAKWRAHLDKLESLRHYRPQLPGTLQAQLRDYQHDGFVWLARLAHWGVGACLADDMGLGKTVQTLALLLHRAADGPQLVVAPTSVALNWLAESQRFAPTLKLRLYQQQRSLDDLGPLDLVIVSYGLLQQDSAAFAARRWTSVVLDEAQAIKNAQTKRSQAVMALQADFRLIATGTPLENHLSELWNLFRFINPALLGSQDSFTARFVNPIENGDAAARRALKQLIQPFILRRLKSQVLDELPPRTEITYKVPLSDDEAHQYEALRQQAVETINQLDPDAGKPLQVLAEITRLRRFCCHPSLVLPGSELAGSKLLALREIIAELLANRHKALVFSQFVDHLQIVRTWLDQQGIAYQYLDGATPAKERKKRVDAFQAGSGELFLISLKAGGSGLNLTAADYVIHLDPWWNPAVEDQASDRAHRMGQQRPVTIYRLVAEGTIEEQIVALHGRKRDLADSLLEGGEVSAKLDADALLQLLKG